MEGLALYFLIGVGLFLAGTVGFFVWCAWADTHPEFFNKDN